MKKRRFVLTFFIILLSLGVGWYLLKPAEPETNHASVFPTDELTLWIVSDIHYLSPELYDDGEAFQFIEKTAAGKDLHHSKEVMTAFTEQVKQDQPDGLIVSGDLTMNGEKLSAEELADFFQQMTEIGTHVYVIPGNHDINNGWARKFVGTEQEHISQIAPTAFTKLFAASGYNEASAKDPRSLSYKVALSPAIDLLMIDSNTYPMEASTSAPATGGYIKEDTYDWLFEQLRESADNGKIVIPILHHNLFAHNRYVTKGFVLDDDQRLIDMLLERDVRVAFSGHIHAQDIVTEVFDEQKLTEIVNGSFDITPNGYGVIKLSKDSLTYERRALDVNHWAQVTNQTDPELLDYSHYLDQLFFKDGASMAYRQLYETGMRDEAKMDTIADFVGELNNRFFKGEDWDSAREINQLKQTEGYHLLQETDNSFLIEYVDSILVDDNEADQAITIPLR